MEVTNNNSTSFAPKLGSVSAGTTSDDAFSSHLQEAQTSRRPRDEERRVENDDRPDASQRSEAKEENREARSRETNENARDRDDAASDTSSQTAENDDATLEAAIADGLALEGGELLATEGELEVDGNLEFSDELTTATTDAEIDTGAASTNPGEVKLADNAAQNVIDGAGETIITDGASDADIAAAQDEKALAATRAANATNITAAQTASANQAATTSTAAPTQPGQTANLSAETGQGESTEETGLPNPLGANAEGDGEAGGDSTGEKGLGQQAADAMAAKNNKPDATQANATTPTTPQASTSIMAAVPVQALTSLGLNTTALPTDMDIDLLNLNATGQSSGAGTPQNANPTMVRFGALPGQAQATQVPNTAIALQIAKHVAKGVSTFEIRIDPPEMGRIDVKLELAQDGRVTAHLAVEKSETLDMLQRDAKALEQALRDAGLEADADTLNFSLQDGAGSDDFAAQSEGGAGANPSDGESEAVSRDDALMNAMVARQIDAAARGGIDVSI